MLSEKPAAPTLEAAEQLLAFQASLPPPRPLWCVAENYRCVAENYRCALRGVVGVAAHLGLGAGAQDACMCVLRCFAVRFAFCGLRLASMRAQAAKALLWFGCCS